MPRGLKLRAPKSKDFEWIPALSNAGSQDIENSFSVSIPAINLSNILYSEPLAKLWGNVMEKRLSTYQM